MQHVENELDNTLEKLGGTNVKLDEKVKLVSYELQHFGDIAGIFPQIKELPWVRVTEMYLPLFEDFLL